MKIVVGLGNPGAEYVSTPHSVGFEVVDAIASAAGSVWENKRAFSCVMAKCFIGSESVLLVKPQTFMNLSGNCVAPVVKYHNAGPVDLIVVQDDIDLSLGRIRIRKNGSCGGHNGIRNIIERLGTQEFTRIKLGVGNDKTNVIAHVLGKFSPEARSIMDLEVAEALKAVVSVVKFGADRAMNIHNAWKAPQS